MEKQKRITIFSPEMKDREEISSAVENYFKKEFGDYINYFQIQKFAALNEPDIQKQIGHCYEILVVLDRRLCPKENRSKFIKDTLYFRTLKIALEMTKKLCEEANIPYVNYEGEITKRNEPKFINKIESLKEKIKSRLEEKLIPSN